MSLRVAGPVWKTLPQTPQSAEYVAAGVAFQLASAALLIHSDCKGVVKDHSDPKTALNSRRMHGGTVRFSYRHRRADSTMHKVKAHQDVQKLAAQGASEVALFQAFGNQAADEAAKEAVKNFHPPISQLARNLLQSKFKTLRLVLNVVAALLPLFPRATGVVAKRGGRRPKPLHHGASAHKWVVQDGVWHCPRCLILVKADPAIAKADEERILPNGPCEQPTEVMKRLRGDLGRGHLLQAFGTDKGLMVACVTCGGYTMAGSWPKCRRRRLAKQCCGHSEAASQRTALRRMERGKHPARPYAIYPIAAAKVASLALAIDSSRTQALQHKRRRSRGQRTPALETAASIGSLAAEDAAGPQLVVTSLEVLPHLPVDRVTPTAAISTDAPIARSPSSTCRSSPAPDAAPPPASASITPAQARLAALRARITARSGSTMDV